MTSTDNTDNLDTYLYEDAQFVGVHPDALGTDPFFTKGLEIAVGANRHEKNWRTVPMTRGKLVHDLITFKRGPKDGACITQGPLINGQRIAKNVIANHIIMLDCDTGESLASLERKVLDAGLFAVLWTTYSHMKAITEIPEDRLVKLARDIRVPMPNVEDEQPELCALAEKYLASKKYNTAILASITRIDKQHREGGIKYVVHHDPMPRARIMMFLKDPYIFATAKATQAQAIQDWKEAYAGVAEILGVDYDQSCVDPSRLMYTPRLPHDIDDFVEAGHDILVIGGNALDLDTVPRIKKGERYTATDQNPLVAAADNVGVSGDARKAYPQWLLKFLKKHGDDFDIIGFCEAYDELLSNNGEKAELTCPNEERHTEQKADDRAFCVMNSEGGFWAGCQHATCKEDSGGDRAWWLQKLCEKYGVGYDDLLAYCANASEEEAEKIEDQKSARQEATDWFKHFQYDDEDRALSADVRTAADAVGRIDDDVERAALTRQLIKASGWTKGEIDPIVRSARAEALAQREAERQVVIDMAPVPDNPEDAAVIWLHWDQMDQNRCAFARFEKLNKENPKMYRRPEGDVVTVVNNTKAGVRIAELPSIGDTIGTVLSDFGIRFITTDDEGRENERAAPKYVVSYIRGKLHEMVLPELEKVTKVPVFSSDGVLITQKGYNPHTNCYYDPGDQEFYDVPELVSEEDVVTAVSILDEPKRDFPFSDVFTGADPQPIRSDKKDEDGFPLPNYERGKGSRANYDAMIIQPFVRAMIPGPCPQYHIDKPAVGTGAGYLVDVAWIIAEGGDRAEVKTLPHDNGMIKSMLTSGLRGGKSILFLDNVQDQVNSPDLAAALTAGSWSDRLFRTHDEVIIPIKCTWIMAGNRIQFNRDMMRRNVPIYLNAETPNPASDRPVTFYKHQMLHEYVCKHRKDLVWAIHVLVKNWIQKGQPVPKKSPIMQSFNDYSVVLGGILEAAKIEGFLSNRDAYMEARDEEGQKGEALIRRIWQKYGEDEKSIKDWIEACATEGESGLSIFNNAKGQDIILDTTLGLDTITSTRMNGMMQQLGAYVQKECANSTYAVDDNTKVIVQAWRGSNKTWAYQLKKVSTQNV